MHPEVEDQLVGLSWALAITGGLVTLVEWLILPGDVFARVAPYTAGTLVLGIAGGFWLRRRRGRQAGSAPEEA